MTEQDDCRNETNKPQQKEEKEKVPVLVRRYKHNDQEELSAEKDKHRPFETPRRWRIY